MSYDLFIRSDASYSLFAPYAPLKEFLFSLPCIVENGEVGFAFDEPSRRWMEIYPAVVDSDGNDEEMAPAEPVAINSIHFRIPYCFDRNDPESDYLPTVVAVARFLGWQIYDPQGDEIIPNSAVMPARPKGRLDG